MILYHRYTHHCVGRFQNRRGAVPTSLAHVLNSTGGPDTRCSCRQGVRRPGFVRGRGRAPRERPQGLGPRCPASSARPHWSCSPPEQYGRASGRWHMPHPVRGALGNRISWLRTHKRRGHSLERPVFRKCTFGAKMRLHAWRLLPPTAGRRPRFVRVGGTATQ